MPSPEQNPTDPRPAGYDPDQAPTPSTDPNQNASGNPASPAKDGSTPQSTQENMGDGAGIRGDYGNASQTNGLEGGPEQPMTDTELTGS